jgi:hypothetical protein
LNKISKGGDKQLTQFGVYLGHILKIQEELSKDRLWQFITDEEYQRLFKKLEEFWIELNRLDVEHGHIPLGNIKAENIK